MLTRVEAGLFCYTTEIVAEDFYCCFMNVQMAYESASVFVWPFEVSSFNLKCSVGLGPLFLTWEAKWQRSSHACLYQGWAPWIERPVAFCFGNEFADSGSSLKHQILIKLSSWTQHSQPWTKSAFVNNGGKDPPTCWLAQPLCIRSKVVQVQKQKHLQSVVSVFSSIFISIK